MSEQEGEKETVRYLIQYMGGKPDEIVTVPRKWKVTFGSVAPGARHHDERGWTLRFWEAKDKQRAVFANVSQFRMLDDITVERKRSQQELEKIAQNRIVADEEYDKFFLVDV